MTCPVFFGLFLKPCRGRQTRGVSLRTSQNASQLRKLGYKRTSCNFCPHNTKTHAHLGRHTVHSPTRGRAAAQDAKRQLFCVVSSATVLRKASPAARSFPVGASFSEALKYNICTICSTDISSVLITQLAHTNSSTRISQLSH